MCDYLDENRSIFAFRRAVPDELQPFIRSKTGKPRTEWRISLRTTDRRTAHERCRVEAVRTDKLLAKARADLASFEIESLKSPAQREADRAAWDYEMEAIERSADDAMKDAWALEDREPLRQAIIADLNRPQHELSQHQIALRELIPDQEFEAPEIRSAREQENERRWAEGAEQVVRAMAPLGPLSGDEPLTASDPKQTSGSPRRAIQTSAVNGLPGHRRGRPTMPPFVRRNLVAQVRVRSKQPQSPQEGTGKSARSA